jgi:WXG100 family type VII secretion target
VRDDEQVYPIETAAEVEDVSGLSALQVRSLVLAGNPEAIYAAAKDYLCTAERLEATADGIRRGATDLADSWHGSAADASQHQMQQYYASARSLATACRASATALSHAAAALTAAQVQVLFLPGGDFPSLDPTSLESRCYQKTLADLNAAYRDALTLAPTEIAVTLPEADARNVDLQMALWEDMDRTEEVSTPGTGTSGTSGTGATLAPGGSAISGEYRPKMLPPSIPSNPAGSASHAERSNMGEAGDSASDPRWERLPSIATGRDEDVRTAGIPYDAAETPYDAGSSLAGVNGLREGLEVGRERWPELPSSSARASAAQPNVIGGLAPGGLGGNGAQSGAMNNGSVFPANGVQRDSDRERGRRYYLKEERDVWGQSDLPPAVLRGESFTRASIDDDDEDYDDF